MLSGECLHTEMFESEPFFDERVCCVMHQAPGRNYFAVVDDDVGC